MNSCRILLALVALSCIGSGPVAAGEANFGIRFGVGGSSFRNADYDAENRIGIQAGLFGRYEFVPKFALRLEAVYAQKGTDAGDATVALDYIDFPLLAEFSFPSAGFTPTFFSGPALGIRMVGELRVGSESDDYGDLAEKYETSWIFGLGSTTAIGGRDVLFDLRYALGLSSVFDFGSDDSDSDDKNQVISFNVSVAIF